MLSWFQGFKDVVVEHFRNRAHNIMGACKAFQEGAQADSLVKSGFHDVDEGNKTCSEVFKNSICEPMEELVKEFEKIGAKYWKIPLLQNNILYEFPNLRLYSKVYYILLYAVFYLNISKTGIE